MKVLCFVRGCRDRAVVCARHRLFGRVAACAGHDPLKHGYATELDGSRRRHLPAVITPKSADERPNEGPMARLTHPVPPVPPAGGTVAPAWDRVPAPPASPFTDPL